MEAVSEGASNHSVASSLELENENDNFSDMVSANVRYDTRCNLSLLLFTFLLHVYCVTRHKNTTSTLLYYTNDTSITNFQLQKKKKY